MYVYIYRLASIWSVLIKRIYCHQNADCIYNRRWLWQAGHSPKTWESWVSPQIQTRHFGPSKMELMIPLISQFQGYFGRSFISLIVSFIEADLLYINKLNICWSKWRKCNLFCYLAVTSLTNNTRKQCWSPCFGYHMCKTGFGQKAGSANLRRHSRS